jgi:HlyD family secretion protein
VSSAKGAVSLFSLGQRPRNLSVPCASAESALQQRLWSLGRVVPRRIARLTRAFSACRDLCIVPAAMPQTAIEAAPSALNRYLPTAGRICGGKLSELTRAVGALAFLLLLAACGNRGKAVSGTIEVDEAHVGPRSGGRVEKILAWEGDHLKEGQLIVQLDASELKARRDLAVAQIDTAVHDADAQEAQLVFLRDEAQRQQDLLKRKVVSSSDAERAGSSAKTQEKNVAAAQMRVAQARAQLADIDAQLAEMQVTAPADSVLEVLSVKVGDVLPANREAATLLLTGHLWVRVYVPESWLGLIKLGEHVRVRVDSFPGKDFDGVVEQINRQAEFTPRNVQTVADRIKQVFGVKIRLPSDDDRLRGGMAADVYFPNVK